MLRKMTVTRGRYNMRSHWQNLQITYWVKEKTVGEFICPMASLPWVLIHFLVCLTPEFIGKPSTPHSGYLLLHHKPPQRVALNNTHLFCLDWLGLGRQLLFGVPQTIAVRWSWAWGHLESDFTPVSGARVGNTQTAGAPWAYLFQEWWSPNMVSL